MKRGFSILAIVTALLLSFALYEALVGEGLRAFLTEMRNA